ncbi:MAG: hypothetical protein HUU21_20990 [Polyangiaceae bacterium]|nr:hypothetical protein [Polyangiaceae bacterium]
MPEAGQVTWWEATGELMAPQREDLEFWYAINEDFMGAVHYVSNDLNVGAEVRKLYIATAKAFSKLIGDDVKAGKLTARAAAEEMHFLRGVVLNASRTRLAQDAPLSLLVSEWKKEGNRSLPELLETYSQRLYKKSWLSVSVREERKVYIEIVEAGGRPVRNITILSRAAQGLGIALQVITVLLAVHEIYESKSKLDTAARLTFSLGGSIVGATVLGTTFLTGLIGSVIGAFAGEGLYHVFKAGMHVLIEHRLHVLGAAPKPLWYPKVACTEDMRYKIDPNSVCSKTDEDRAVAQIIHAYQKAEQDGSLPDPSISFGSD